MSTGYRSLTLTRRDILIKLRLDAAKLDPVNEFTYLGMDVDRWLAAAILASELLDAHRQYKRYRGVGRRAHSAEIHALLHDTNSVQLTAGLAWINLAIPVLAPLRSPGQ